MEEISKNVLAMYNDMKPVTANCSNSLSLTIPQKRKLTSEIIDDDNDENNDFQEKSTKKKSLFSFFGENVFGR